MEEKSIIKEKFQLELNLLVKDMENYYHILLKQNEIKNDNQQMEAFKSGILFTEQLLKERIEKALFLSSLFLTSKLEDKPENIDLNALWQILKHPILNEGFVKEKLSELNALKERIGLFKTKKF